MTAGPLLAIQDLHAYYGEAHILQGVSLAVQPGEVVTLIGRNGAGKTTTLRSILGIVAPRGGHITFDGVELAGLPTHTIAQRGIAYVPEERRILPNLSVEENLRLGRLGAGGSRSDGDAVMEEVLGHFPRLRERLAQKGKSLSGGEQQMLAIARGLVASPKLMLVDEPTEGLSPDHRGEPHRRSCARSTVAAPPSCWSSRSSRSRSRSPTGSTSWIRAASSSRGRPRHCAPTPPSSSASSASSRAAGFTQSTIASVAPRPVPSLSAGSFYTGLAIRTHSMIRRPSCGRENRHRTGRLAGSAPGTGDASSTPGGTPPMRWLRMRAPRAGRRVVIAGAILALAIGVTGYYASPAVVRHLLISQIESRTHRSVSIDAVSLNPFTGRLVVRGFRLQEPDGKTPFTDFDRLDVRVRPLSLLRGHLWIREVTLEGSTVRIIRFAEGFNISDLISSSGGSGRTLDVTVDRLVVTKGTVALEDRALAEPRTWYSENIEIEARNLSTLRGDGRAVARSVTVGAPVLLEMQHVRLYPIHLEAAVTTSELDLSLARLYFPRDAAVVLERGRASSTLKVALDARAGVRADISGSLEDVVLVRRGERDPSVLLPKLTVELADFQYQDDQVQVGRFELAGSASVKDPSARGGGRFQVSTLRASVADVTWPVLRPGRVDVRSSVPGGGLLNLTGRLSPPPDASQLRLQLERVDLGPWARLVPSSLRIEGLAEANLHVDEPLAPAVPTRVQGSIAVNQLGVKDASQEVLRARRIEATGLEVQWPSRLAVRQLVISGPRATIERDSAGSIAVPGRPNAAAPVPTGSASAGPASPLALAVGEIVVKDGGLSWRDHAVKPDVALEFARLEARITGAAWPLRGPLGVRAGVRPPGGGRVEVNGRVGVDPITAEGQVTAIDAEVAPYRAYVPLPARISGRVDFDLAVALPPVTEGRAIARGRAGASSIDVRDGERTVMRVERARATGVEVDWPRRVAIRDVTLQRPWILLERDQGGALPLRTLLTPRGANKSAQNGSAPSGGATVPVTVDHLLFEDGGARTVDQRVAPPFALDTQRVTGRLDGLSTDPAARPARLEMAGRVGADSSLTLRGTLGSLGGPLRLDMSADLHGFAVPRTNPYLVQQVAWEARSGSLTTSVRCRIDGDALDAKTEILLSRLEVARAGGPDEAQARIGLPLGTIVALMKDRRGDIRVSLPVGGRLSDPRFDVSEALWSTVRNVAVKAITAPVSWIGRVQVGANSRIERVDVDPIPFAPGSASLAPEAQEQVARLAAFLDQVPEVRLALLPVVSSRDRAALEEKAREPAAGLLRERKTSPESLTERAEAPRAGLADTGVGDKGPSKTELADLAARRLEAVREGIKKAGGDGGRLKIAAPSTAESAEGQVKVDLVEPENPGPPGRPGFLRRLLGQAGPDGRPARN